jgi:hypothetical protein
MKYKRLTEIIVWLVLAILFSWRLIAIIFENIIEGHGVPYLYEFYSDIIFSSLVIIFPIIFNVIFGELPFEYVRNRNLEKIRDKRHRIQNIKVSGNSNVIIQDSSNDELINDVKSEKYLMLLANDSKRLSEKVYSRSGLYLLVGCMIALIGILYFSIQSIDVLKSESVPLTNQLILMLPRIGALLFIELIAFFFLKQYRITMDEFRHYENIKRQRESDLAKFKIIENADNKDDSFKLIEKLSLHVVHENLKKDESTELLELRKLDKSELDILSKILEKIPLGK